MKKIQQVASLIPTDHSTEITPADSHLVEIGDRGDIERSLNLGVFAHRVLGEQFQRVIKYETKVLADQDPEPLHHMRVGLRRLRTAVEIFKQAIKLPKTGRDNQLRQLSQVLGKLRDLDVQIAALKEDYQPRLNKTEQSLLGKDLPMLQKQRRKAFTAVKDQLTHPSYHHLKAAYQEWLQQPRFQPLAQLPVLTVLPDILSPLLSTLLLHPGWLISTHQLSPDHAPVLHDLRKLCKRVRYQTEFFASFYSESFHAWVEEMRDLQDCLGKVQDGHVLLDLFSRKLHHTTDMPELYATIRHNQEEALESWETMRQKYLNSVFRYQLHQGLLVPEPFYTS